MGPRRAYTTRVLPRVSDLVAGAIRSEALEGSTTVGEASGGTLLVRVGLWLEGVRVVRARWKASTCASLIAYAEAACAALERGADPSALDAAAVRRLVAGVHPVHHDRAALVARAVLHARERARAGFPAAASRGGAAA